ncbi:MAG: hypothetical protein KAW09_11445 [Thermoplasmata archaeon]|nr:hypothetical protein [Thermoplasmata archaeon]
MGKITDTKKREELAEAQMKQRTLISLELPATVVLFSFALWFIAVSKEELADDLYIAACLNMGVSGFIVAIAEGYHVRVNTKAIFEDPELWGKSIVCMTVAEVAVLWSFAIAFLTLSRYEGTVTNLLEPNYITMVASVGSLVAVLLMTKASLEDFTKKIMLSMPGLFISMIGFGLAYAVMVPLF